jgi:hypothetical protein
VRTPDLGQDPKETQQELYKRRVILLSLYCNAQPHSFSALRFLSTYSFYLTTSELPPFQFTGFPGGVPNNDLQNQFHFYVSPHAQDANMGPINANTGTFNANVGGPFNANMGLFINGTQVCLTSNFRMPWLANDCTGNPA